MRPNIRWTTVLAASVLAACLLVPAGAAGQNVYGFTSSVYRPHGVSVDSSSVTYIADTSNHRVIKVTSSGSLSVLAGIATPGSSGDGGPATSAQLNQPFDVAVDAAGNVYIADTGNQKIRKVDTSGVITTFAGTGTRAYGGDGGPATAAKFNSPYAVAVKGSDVFISDTFNQRIRKVDSAGRITTVAGDGFSLSGNARYYGDRGPATSASLNYPYDIAFGPDGSMFIADTSNNRIRKVDLSGTINTVAGNGAPVPATSLLGGGIPTYVVDAGPALAATLNAPSGIALDAMGNLYIADSLNSRIRMVDNLGMISTIAGGPLAGNSGNGGPATDARLAFPYGLAVRGNQLIFSESANNQVRLVEPI